jgi:hypothetical protein
MGSFLVFSDLDEIVFYFLEDLESLMAGAA